MRAISVILAIATIDSGVEFPFQCLFDRDDYAQMGDAVPELEGIDRRVVGYFARIDFQRLRQ